MDGVGGSTPPKGDGVGTVATLHGVEGKLRHGRMRVAACEETTQKNMAELAEVQVASEKLADAVRDQEREVARVKLVLGLGPHEMVELAATAGHLETAWDALPSALHSGTCAQALPATDGYVRELIAAFRRLQTAGMKTMDATARW